MSATDFDCLDEPEWIDQAVSTLNAKGWDVLLGRTSAVRASAVITTGDPPQPVTSAIGGSLSEALERAWDRLGELSAQLPGAGVH